MLLGAWLPGLPCWDGFCCVLRSVCRDEIVFVLCDSNLSREHLALSSPPNSVIRNIIQKIERKSKATFATPKCLLDEHANTHAEQSQGRIYEWYRGPGCGFCYFPNIFTKHRPAHLKDKNSDDSHSGIQSNQHAQTSHRPVGALYLGCTCRKFLAAGETRIRSVKQSNISSLRRAGARAKAISRGERPATLINWFCV